VFDVQGNNSRAMSASLLKPETERLRGRGRQVERRERLGRRYGRMTNMGDDWSTGVPGSIVSSLS
jgi:hypothetical protein